MFKDTIDKGIDLHASGIKNQEIEQYDFLRNNLVKEGFFLNSEDRWRLSPYPFFISREEYTFLESLGPLFLSFYRAINKLYMLSFKGEVPSWVKEYLDMGKPDSILRYARMKRFRQNLPIIIRPDIILTDSGMVITELDAVPGGMGTTAILSRLYNGEDIVGGFNGMIEGFSEALRSLAPGKEPNVAIVVSEESRDYRPEMAYIVREFNKLGLCAYLLRPEDVVFTENGLLVEEGGRKKEIHVLYRFFELFDIINIPKAELIFYAAKKKKVALTPPPKPFLEEKLSYALFHHPALKVFWYKEIGREGYDRLKALLPMTWILDPRPIAPHGIIPFIEFRGEGVISWDFLRFCTKKERRYVIKPSGFSEFAWGGRGVVVGHDKPLSEWVQHVDKALSTFHTTPHILQEFKHGRKLVARFYNRKDKRMEEIETRARLTPYYFICESKVRLAGVLATLCPSDKKILHGMGDAIITVCAIRD